MTEGIEGTVERHPGAEGRLTDLRELSAALGLQPRG